MRISGSTTLCSGSLPPNREASFALGRRCRAVDSHVGLNTVGDLNRPTEAILNFISEFVGVLHSCFNFVSCSTCTFQREFSLEIGGIGDTICNALHVYFNLLANRALRATMQIQVAAVQVYHSYLWIYARLGWMAKWYFRGYGFKLSFRRSIAKYKQCCVKQTEPVVNPSKSLARRSSRSAERRKVTSLSTPIKNVEHHSFNVYWQFMVLFAQLA
jgi:hypothetical protein